MDRAVPKPPTIRLNSREIMTDVRTYQYFSNGECWTPRSSSLRRRRAYSRKVMARAPNCGPLRYASHPCGAPSLPRLADSSPAYRAKLFFKAAEIVRRRRGRDNRHSGARNGKYDLLRDVPTGSRDREPRAGAAGSITRAAKYFHPTSPDRILQHPTSIGGRRKLHTLERKRTYYPARGAVASSGG